MTWDEKRASHLHHDWCDIVCTKEKKKKLKKCHRLYPDNTICFTT